MAYSVTRRTQEFGVRMALGAGRSDVFRLVLRRGMMPVMIGLAIGIGAAYGLSRFLAGFLYGVGATDAFTYAGVALLLFLVAMMAGFLPARRATRVDPVIALRYE
jgi:ABC-type antimicrobial peptide transport system permease subunit